VTKALPRDETAIERVPSFGPLDAEYAAVGQSPFTKSAASLAHAWIEAANVSPASMRWLTVYEYELPRGDKPTSTEVKHGIERVKRELAEMPNLRSVILFGSYAAQVAFKLVGGISRAHGKQGKIDLPDGRAIDCVACFHPSYVRGQPSLSRRGLLDSDCRSVVARLTFLDKPLILPPIRIVGNMDADVGPGRIGLDTETAYQVGKKVDPRRDPLLITSLSDGRIIVGAPRLDPNSEPIIYNDPFDPVVLGNPDAKWHDPKLYAWLQGEVDTSMKGMATRVLNRAMMDYDPDLRKRAAEKILRGDFDDPDVKEFCGYAMQDCMAHRDLLDVLEARADAGTRECYERVERPMIPLYSRWTKEGVFRLDREAALKKRDQVDAAVRDGLRDLVAATGVDSVNKHQKLAAAIGVPSTGAPFIEKNWKKLSQSQKQKIRLVQGIRSLEKQNTTYIDKWLEWPYPLLSTDWRPTAAWTGRPGSADLNLQNIPTPCGDCKVCRKGQPRDCPWNLKSLLLAPEGMVLYEADNSQAELRVAAHLSQDPAMIAAFTEGIDIDGVRQFDLHAWAQHRLGFSSRRDAKIRVLATFYGQTGQGARADVGVQDAIRKTFKGYVAWSERVKRLRVVPGLFGRKMYVPPNPNLERMGREAINCGSQGGAVDVLKLQIQDLEAVPGITSRTRHMIHDSVLVAVPESDATLDIENAIRYTMRDAVSLSVPLLVEVKRW
jgi:uracil-DNA glycosylase family 4